jgi:hypothetical protein
MIRKISLVVFIMLLASHVCLAKEAASVEINNVTAAEVREYILKDQLSKGLVSALYVEDDKLFFMRLDDSMMPGFGMTALGTMTSYSMPTKVAVYVEYTFQQLDINVLVPRRT